MTLKERLYRRKKHKKEKRSGFGGDVFWWVEKTLRVLGRLWFLFFFDVLNGYLRGFMMENSRFQEKKGVESRKGG